MISKTHAIFDTLSKSVADPDLASGFEKVSKMACVLLIKVLVSGPALPPVVPVVA